MSETPKWDPAAALVQEYGHVREPGHLWTIATSHGCGGPGAMWCQGEPPKGWPIRVAKLALKGHPFLMGQGFTVDRVEAEGDPDHLVAGDGLIRLLIGVKYYLWAVPAWCPISMRDVPLIIPDRQTFSVDLVSAPEGARVLVTLVGTIYGRPARPPGAEARS